MATSTITLIDSPSFDQQMGEDFVEGKIIDAFEKNGIPLGDYRTFQATLRIPGYDFDVQAAVLKAVTAIFTEGREREAKAAKAA